MSATTALLILAATWVGVGLLLALVMGRHGHDPFAWWLLGTLLGPLALPLAVSAQRRRLGRVWRVRAGRPGPGPVDVLVGLDGSAEAAAALAAALELLGPRLGRLTLATVIDLDASVEHDRALARARAELERQGRLVQLRLSTGEHGPDDGRRVPALVLLTGHPAEALPRLAAEGGYDLLVVGSRGAGLSKVLLGSTATQPGRPRQGAGPGRRRYELAGVERVREMLQTTIRPATVVLDPREVAALPWRPFAGIAGVRDRVLWQDPAGKSLAGLLHLDPDARVLPHIHLRAVHHLWVVSGSCTIDGRTLDAGSYGFVPAGRSHGIEQVGRAGCLLFYVYLYQGTPRQAAATPHGRVALLTVEQQGWAAAAELAGRQHPIAEAS